MRLSVEDRAKTLWTISEKAFMDALIDRARRSGWMVVHFRPCRTATGWRTAVSGDGVGFPDLVLVRAGQLLFLECKAEGGKATREQRAWLDELGTVTGVVARTVWPSSVEWLESVLGEEAADA